MAALASALSGLTKPTPPPDTGANPLTPEQVAAIKADVARLRAGEAAVRDAHASAVRNIPPYTIVMEYPGATSGLIPAKGKTVEWQVVYLEAGAPKP